jgi:hypothetical protein
MNGYIALYNGRRTELYAPTMWDAVLQAREFFKAPKSKAHLVSVHLAEKDGVPVVHTADF